MQVKKNAKQVLKIKFTKYSRGEVEYDVFLGFYFADIVGDGFVSKAQMAKAYPDTKETDFIPNALARARSFRTFEQAEKWAKEYSQKNEIEYIGGDKEYR